MSIDNQFPARWFVPAQNGTGLVPAAGYKLKYYSAGTDIAKTVYTNALLTVPYPSPSNIVTLNSEGYALVYLGPGGYKRVITDPNDNVVYTQDNIQGGQDFGSGFVNSFEDLKDVNTDLSKYTYIGGYYSPGDGGQGMFFNDTSDLSADGGYIQESDYDPTKRWFRIPDENGDVRAASFGYIPSIETIQTSELQAAASYASSIDARLVVQAGLGAQVGAITYNCLVHYEPGARYDGIASPPQPATIFNKPVTGPDEQIFTFRDFGSGPVLSVNVTFSDYQVSSNPYWFGAVPSDGDQTDWLDAWMAAGGGAFILPIGEWGYADVANFPWPSIATFQALGTLVGDDTNWGPGFRLPNGTVRAGYFQTENENIITAYSNSPNTGMLVDGNWHVIGDLHATAYGFIGQALTVEGLTTSGGVQSSEQIHSDTDINADGTVNGGVVASATYVAAVAGTSGLGFKAAGRLVTTIGNAATSGTGATDLLSHSIPSNTLAANGDSLKILAAGWGTAGAANSTFTIKLGSTVLFSHVFTSDNITGWRITGDVIRTGATTCSISWTVVTDDVSGSGSSSYPQATGDATATVTWSNANTLLVIGQSSAETLHNTQLLTDYFPAL